MAAEPRIEIATPEHFPAVHARLLRPMDHRIPEGTWRRLFDQPWARPDDILGHVLLMGGEPVGYAGFIHARLPRPDGSETHLCNLTTWVVDPAHRHVAASLVMPLLRLPGATVTSLTNISAVAPVLSRLGFRDLETARCFMRPVAFDARGWRSPEVLVGYEAVRAALPEWEGRIAEDHRDLAEHVMIREPGGLHCYVIVTRGRWRRIPTARLRWVTPGTLADAAPTLRKALRRRLGTPLVEADARFVPPEVRGVFCRRMDVPRMFRPGGLGPEEVPGAYSELVLLGL